mmetsp:Transcript_8588/g.35406  ORF Transcript_8588/g.35406 Transcript_8588/m.35406 type:complete len:283 (-) Transcript_8588:1147-1995(-)
MTTRCPTSSWRRRSAGLTEMALPVEMGRCARGDSRTSSSSSSPCDAQCTSATSSWRETSEKGVRSRSDAVFSAGGGGGGRLSTTETSSSSLAPIDVENAVAIERRWLARRTRRWRWARRWSAAPDTAATKRPAQPRTTAAPRIVSHASSSFSNPMRACVAPNAASGTASSVSSMAMSWSVAGSTTYDLTRTRRTAEVQSGRHVASSYMASYSSNETPRTDEAASADADGARPLLRFFDEDDRRNDRGPCGEDGLAAAASALSASNWCLRATASRAGSSSSSR